MIRTMTEVDVKHCLKTVLQKIEDASKKRPLEYQYFTPRLVAVSKIKPVSDIIKAYEAGQRHFGENYVQELEEKATNREILEQCKEIQWHFIGHLQSNKINKVLCLPNLYIIETVHSIKLADAINRNWEKFRKEPDSKLNVYVQVNTSGEDEKSGVPPSESSNLAKHILNNCSNLKLKGFMTIGQYGYDTSKGLNPDFLCLIKCRKDFCEELGRDWKEFEISMGMSADYEQAVELGSNNVRVGSHIFGDRPQKH